MATVMATHHIPTSTQPGGATDASLEAYNNSFTLPVAVDVGGVASSSGSSSMVDDHNHQYGASYDQDAIFLQQLREQPSNTQCSECQNRNPEFVAFLSPPAILVNDMEGLQLHQKLGGLGVFCCNSCAGYHMQVGNPVKRLTNTDDGEKLTTLEREALRASGNRVVNDIWEATMDGYDKDIDDENDEAGEERATYMFMKYNQLRYFEESAYRRHMLYRKQQLEEARQELLAEAAAAAATTTHPENGGEGSSMPNLGYGDEQEYGNTGFSNSYSSQMSSTNQNEVVDQIIRRRRNLSIGAPAADSTDRRAGLRKAPSARGMQQQQQVDSRRSGMKRMSSMRVSSSSSSGNLADGIKMPNNTPNDYVAAEESHGPGGRRTLSRQHSMPVVTRSLVPVDQQQPELEQRLLLAQQELQQAEGALARMKASTGTTRTARRQHATAGRRHTGSHSPQPPPNRSISMRAARTGSMGHLLSTEDLSYEQPQPQQQQQQQQQPPQDSRSMRQRRTASMAVGPREHQQEVNTGTKGGFRKRSGSTGNLSSLMERGGRSERAERTGRLKKHSSIRSMGSNLSSRGGQESADPQQQSEKSRRKQRTAGSKSSTSPKRSVSGRKVRSVVDDPNRPKQQQSDRPSPKRASSGRTLGSLTGGDDPNKINRHASPRRASSGRNLMGSRGSTDDANSRPKLDRASSMRRVSASRGLLPRQNSSRSFATAPLNRVTNGETGTITKKEHRQQRESSRDCRETNNKQSKRGSLEHHFASSRGREEESRSQSPERGGDSGRKHSSEHRGDSGKEKESRRRRSSKGSSNRKEDDRERRTRSSSRRPGRDRSDHNRKEDERGGERRRSSSRHPRDKSVDKHERSSDRRSSKSGGGSSSKTSSSKSGSSGSRRSSSKASGSKSRTRSSSQSGLRASTSSSRRSSSRKASSRSKSSSNLEADLMKQREELLKKAKNAKKGAKDNRSD